jgi:Ca2+-binding RTX toxin-like protein
MTKIAIRLIGVAVLIAGGVMAAPAHAAQSCRGRTATVVGTPGDDVIRGTADGEVIHGLGGDDVILSNGAAPQEADVVCGGWGADRLEGSEGDEILFGGPGRDALEGHGAAEGDLLAGGRGDDALDGGAGAYRTVASFVTATHSVSVVLRAGAGTASGQGRDTLANIWEVVGSDRGDTITGGARRGIAGRGGDDTITVNATAVPDLVTGGRGDDDLTVEAGAFEGLLVGGAGNDVLRGSRGDDSRLDGGPGSDHVLGRDGIDDLAGCSAGDKRTDRDVLDGGAGEDEVSFSACGAAVAASLFSGEAALEGGRRVSLADFENLEGSRFGDVLVGNAGANALEDGGFGVDDDDVVRGFGGDDYLLAGGGQDDVRGGRGDDFLDVADGVSGNDRADGGDGSDGCRADVGDMLQACER